ncbi:MAG: DHH family phosphoesterase [Candidatus Nealsonbacteria bacterium]
MTNQTSHNFDRLTDIINQSKKVLIASHHRPDPDAVASVLVFHYLLKNKQIESVPYLPEKPTENLSFLPGFADIITDVSSFIPDTLICLDYGDFKRMELPQNIASLDESRIVTIDHHPESDQRGDIKIIKPEYSSTAEIIYHWMKYANIEINQELATLLLSGIFADSGGFSHVSTSPKTLNVVSDLLLKGVSMQKIARNTLNFQKPLHISRAWGHVLTRTQVDEKTGLAYSWITPDEMLNFKVSIVDFDGITNIIAAASLINLGLFMVEYEKGKVKGSLRSEPRSRQNVGEMVKGLGGGGHPYAAGFDQDGTADEILKKVLNLIQ